MSTASRFLDARRWLYLWQGITALPSQRRCPCCGDAGATRVDRKFVYTLCACHGCEILYRHPRESSAAMNEFYQGEYAEPGLTTELPSRLELDALLAVDFKDSAKDFSRVVRALRALGLAPGARVLDFGANWGYATHQLRKAGFETEAYELSIPRAAYGRELEIEIHTQLTEVPGPFDAVYSSHVLEHVPNPLATLRDLLARVRPGGFVLAHTPNGSLEHRKLAFRTFHLHWGQVHPVLLTERFVARNFSDHPFYVGDVGQLGEWNQETAELRAVAESELFFAIRRPA
jgi:2-polyprenyl-3-methyl-5-hydroxy-6-metoxy-1,4-benzoquinol methylase